MELDELKSAWSSVNRRLDEMQEQQNALQNMALDAQTNKSANALRREPIFELAVAILTVIWSGNFLWENLAALQRSPFSALPVGMLHALAIVTIGLSVRQLITIASLDYSQPILDTQVKIASLRSLRVRSTQWLFLIGLPLWVLIPSIAGQAIVGVGFIHEIDKGWLVANLVFGVAAAAAIVYAARRLRDRSSVFQKIDDLIAGTAIAKAQRLLADVQGFARP